jgi:hypothetical protein
MPIKKHNFTNCRQRYSWICSSICLFINEQRVGERDGNVIILNNSNIFILNSLLMFSTRNNSSDQKIIEKFNDESPKSVKRINGLGCLKRYFDYQLVLIFALPA